MSGVEVPLTALVSDIHGNLPALQAVLADIDRFKPERIVCLGDTIGYGPQPRECLALLRRRANILLMGNHEHAILHGAEHFTPLARLAIDWTAQQFREESLMRFLAGLPPKYRDGRVLFAHGSVRDPLFDYVREADSPWVYYHLVKTLREEFLNFDLCFVGHNHRAFLGTEVGYIFPHAEGGDESRMTFQVGGQKAYVSVGSVGQPRDGDWRASWVLFDGTKVTYRRVEYDCRKTMDLIARAGLPSYLADRLLEGN